MKVLIAGDYCPQLRVAKMFEARIFENVLGKIKPIINNSDFSIVNFECPVCFGSEKPIEKCGSNLKCSEVSVEAIKYAGFDAVTLANNHFLDYGEEGVINTLEACKKYKIDIVGGGRNLLDASRVLYKHIGNETIAIINCCEHEFSISSEVTAGSNPLNPIQQYYSIKEAQKNADYIIVIVHGGNEYYQLPSPRMKETYRFFIDAGADAVINHHQHCFSGYEYYLDKPIIYGLGNFCFDENNKYGRIWNEGYFAQLEFINESVSFVPIPYVQCLEKPEVREMTDKEFDLFSKRMSEINSFINNNYLLKESYEVFLEKSLFTISSLFEPYRNKLFKLLYRYHLLPSVLNQSQKLLLLAYLQCESHLPKVFNFLKKTK